ncbi:hypothetical protein CRENBAI_003201 [Crenichthys baileyi]|uniref:Dynein heavy chain C-terminal domain-containing protein n=1 Tax=Crenichthys baileyi TaxID=28760 RepID=A0AAV9RGR0_9TELE
MGEELGPGRGVGVRAACSPPISKGASWGVARESIPGALLDAFLGRFFPGTSYWEEGPRGRPRKPPEGKIVLSTSGGKRLGSPRRNWRRYLGRGKSGCLFWLYCLRDPVTDETEDNKYEYNDVMQRCKELDSWTQDLSLPSVVWLSGLFNPQSFLTAVMQSLARKNEWPLDKVNLTVDVTKKYKEEFNQPAREGAYVYGLYMEGARWDTQTGVITEARLKELTPAMPVISVRAVPNDRQETRNIYECPLYKTKIRGPTYVWTFSLKTRERPAKWVLAGVALLLSV